jgi:hypothetical protein
LIPAAGGNRFGATAQLTLATIKHLIPKQKLALSAPAGAASVSGNNQAHLKDKSSSGQSLLGETGVLTSQSILQM